VCSVPRLTSLPVQRGGRDNTAGDTAGDESRLGDQTLGIGSNNSSSGGGGGSSKAT
jgi:hypothetical protein